jgi:hypothetical protein
LNKITARGPDDVIIVGSIGPLPLMLHWNGSAWRMGQTPTAGILNDVSTSDGVVWAAGLRPGGRAPRTLLLRWDGQRWQTVWTPNATSQSNNLTGVAAAPGGAIFAVGDAQRRRGYGQLPLVLQRCAY